MATFVLIPGAGGAAWCWHRVVAELTARGHDAIAVGLPLVLSSSSAASHQSDLAPPPTRWTATTSSP
jgi:hypothetical protein